MVSFPKWASMGIMALGFLLLLVALLADIAGIGQGQYTFGWKQVVASIAGLAMLGFGGATLFLMGRSR